MPSVCGIAGTLGLPDLEIAERMAEAVAHRGPDGRGSWWDPQNQIALAHRRLAIIDLSPAGQQPMADASGRYHIVYNGEVYNFESLREQLVSLGHAFHSRTDTEVILAAFAEWGPPCLSRFRGMFAFAIWDSGLVRGSLASPPALFLARDRFGIKPLYYAQISDGSFLFASELTALLASGEIERSIDPQSLWDYLSIGSVPQPRTILAQVRALPAGHWMRIHVGGRVEEERYWDLAEAAERSRADRPSDLAEAAGQLRSILEEATRLHMIADVPVGAFLSGGIDSTAVVGLMSQQVSAPLKTFSVTFEGGTSDNDERPWARLASSRFGTDHHEVRITDRQVAQAYEGLIGSVDQPSLDGANSYFVSQAARAEVTVALSGLGGDELFGGYPHFAMLSRARRLFPQGSFPLRTALAAVPRFLPARVRWPLELLALRPPERYAMLRRVLPEAEKKRVVNDRLGKDAGLRPLADWYAACWKPMADQIAETSYVELASYINHTLLRDLDAMSMAFALEVRPVLLDHRLAEFVFTLPGSFKNAGGRSKVVFIEALRDLVPEEILRRRKVGFEFPYSRWLVGPLRDHARESFGWRGARSIFSQRYIHDALARLTSLTSSPFPLSMWSNLILLDWIRSKGCELS